MARRVTFKDGKKVDLGPIVPRAPQSPKNNFRIIVHPQHKRLLPKTWWDNPAFTSENPPSFRKPEGPSKYLLSRELTKAARWLVEERKFTHKAAAARVTKAFKERFPQAAEKWKNKMVGMEERIVKNLRQGRD